MKNNLFVIGDSFCRETFYAKERPDESKIFWVDNLKEKLKVKNTFCDGEPSRDVQSIIDNWIKIINKISKDDYLIICLPYFRRTRLPLNFNNYEVKDFYVNRFIGTHSYKNQELEFWGKNYDFNFFLKKLSLQEIINTSLASQKNMIEVIESLYELTSCKKYIFSWDEMDVKSSVIEDKEVIEKNIGIWETHRDVFYNTQGKFGMEHDAHWSFKMNELFSEYVITKL